MTTLFISDLHLHASRPAVTECFLRFLQQNASSTDTLYILGDLFEAWVGDDDPDPHNRQVISALRSFTREVPDCYFVRGNRDVMVGKRFAKETGIHLLGEVTKIDLYGQSALISHGDELCTDDHSYQRYRRVVNHPAGRTFFLSLPLSIRMWIARKLRSRSKAETPEKPDYITDVNAEAVAQAFRSWHVTTMIHGHTHRPAIHELSVDGTPCRRIVLGDWYEQGSVLRWDTSGPELQRLFLRN